jgi:hypothetical protein
MAAASGPPRSTNRPGRGAGTAYRPAAQTGADVAGDGGSLAHRVLRGRRTHRPQIVLVQGLGQVGDGGGVADRVHLPVTRNVQKLIDGQPALHHRQTQGRRSAGYR